MYSSMRIPCSFDFMLPAQRFVSEWGTCEANGNGHLDLEEAQKWEDFMAGCSDA